MTNVFAWSSSAMVFSINFKLATKRSSKGYIIFWQMTTKYKQAWLGNRRIITSKSIATKLNTTGKYHNSCGKKRLINDPLIFKQTVIYSSLLKMLRQTKGFSSKYLYYNSSFLLFKNPFLWVNAIKWQIKANRALAEILANVTLLWHCIFNNQCKA